MALLILAAWNQSQSTSNQNDQKNDTSVVSEKDSVVFDSASVGSGIPEDHNKIPSDTLKTK